MDRRGRVSGATEIARAWPSGPLPPLAKPLGEADRLGPLTRQRRDDDQSCGSQVALLAVEWQISDALGQLPAAGRSPAAIALSVAVLNPSKNSNADAAVTGIAISSSVRRNALAAAARTSPRASWTAVSWSSAALSISGSPTWRASVSADR